ncbi:DegT/DnrJ/EryC1/StrS aminotransferase family protein [Candidatus Acetothermia bacterium]|nr:DegT/DnrJ/EryC1/StrS aminotransferase family protein [Candidatus Acetothermia bacterium]MBI3643984.1 DegT/DnrJ/EryC1/StrS aminotransferase family protein [Candidatus Acetothermia bacterium]
MRQTIKDTVEEFWSFEVVEEIGRKRAAPDSVDFLQEFLDLLGIRGAIWPVPSGRRAIEWVLKSTAKPGKDSVLICNFNCPAVSDAVLNAGFVVETFDFSSVNGSIDWGAIVESLKPEHAAIIIPHLFGVPYDFSEIIETCRSMDVLIIEDCAHTVGALIGDRPTGTVGDAAVFSFNYDKPLSLGWGGALLANTKALASKVQIPRMEGISVEWEYKKMSEFNAFLIHRRRMIGHESIFHRAMRKITRANRFDLPDTSIGPLRAALGLWQLERYSKVLKLRNDNANFVVDSSQNYSCWPVGKNIKPAWLRQKVITNLPHQGIAIAKRLRREGMRVGNFNWPKPIDHSQNGKETASHLLSRFGLDIPVHQNMSKDLLRKICHDLNGKDQKDGIIA